MTTNALQIVGVAMVDWELELEEAMIAIQAAEALAKRYRCSVYIMPDLSVVLPEDTKGKPLEIVRYTGGDDED